MSKKRDSFPPDVQGTQSLINMNNSKKEWFTGCCESLQGCEIRPSRGAHLQQDSVSYEKVLCFLAPESELTLWAALTSGIWQTWPSSSFHTLGLRSWDHHVRVLLGDRMTRGASQPRASTCCQMCEWGQPGCRGLRPQERARMWLAEESPWEAHRITKVTRCHFCKPLS